MWSSRAAQHDTWDTLRDELKRMGIRYVLTTSGDSGFRGDPRYSVFEEFRKRFQVIGEGTDSVGFGGVVLW